MSKISEILNRPDRPKIGLVIGSGGIRPIGCVELFQFLDDYEIPIDLIVGCSGGALLGGLRSIGFTSDEVKEMGEFITRQHIFKFNYSAISSLLKIPFFKPYYELASFIKPEPLYDIVRSIFQDLKLEDTNPSLMVQTTEIFSGDSVILSNGLASEAILASLSVVPFLPPKIVGRRWLVDGAFSSLLPLAPAIRRHMDIIITINFNKKRHTTIKPLLSQFLYFLEGCMDGTTDLQNSMVSHIHHYRIINIEVVLDSMINFWDASGFIDYLYQRSKEEVDKVKDEIFQAILDFPNRNIK